MQAEGAVAGWDIGGAHLKLALAVGGRLQRVEQVACPLWRGIGELDRALTSLQRRLPSGEVLHRVTMTGELADCFPDRASGVRALSERFGSLFPGQRVRIFAGETVLLPPGQVEGREAAIASANWLVSARYCARQVGDGLLVDCGSTTTDLVVLRDGAPVIRGYSDAERLASGSLVYTGASRTPVASIASQVPFDGQMTRLAAEQFATMADVYRLTGELEPAFDQDETADGAGRDLSSSARRLARMIGRDHDGELWPCQALAHHLAQLQLMRIYQAASQLLSGLRASPAKAPLIGAGIGRFLARRLALWLGMPYLDFGVLTGAPPRMARAASACAPATALALLQGEA